MSPLADVQRRIRDAVVMGDAASAASLFVGGRDAAQRLAIHLRHYRISLVTAVMGRFPATGWLVGTPDQIIVQLQALAAEGVERVMFQHNDQTDFAALELLARDVLPAVATWP